MVDLIAAGVALLIVGFGVVLVSMMGSQKGEGGVRGGGVVMIGPIPIIFGSDMKWASVAIMLAVALIVLTFLAGWA